MKVVGPFFLCFLCFQLHLPDCSPCVKGKKPHSEKFPNITYTSSACGGKPEFAHSHNCYISDSISELNNTAYLK